MTEAQGWIIIMLLIFLMVEIFWLGYCVEGDIKIAVERLKDSVINELRYGDLASNVLRIESIMESEEKRKREKRKKKEVSE